MRSARDEYCYARSRFSVGDRPTSTGAKTVFASRERTRGSLVLDGRIVRWRWLEGRGVANNGLLPGVQQYDNGARALRDRYVSDARGGC